MANLWERQEYDTEDSWIAFQSYRDQIPPRRAMRPGPGWTTAQASEWFRTCRWKERVEAYDRHIDAVRMEEREALLRQSEREITAEHMAILADARDLVGRELNKLLADSRAGVCGGQVMRASEINKLLEMTIKLDRLVRGASTENTATAVDLSGLSDEDLATLDAVQRKAGLS